MNTATHDTLTEAYGATASDADLVMMEEGFEAQRELDQLIYTGIALGLTSYSFAAMQLPFAAPLTESPF